MAKAKERAMTDDNQSTGCNPGQDQNFDENEQAKSWSNICKLAAKLSPDGEHDRRKSRQAYLRGKLEDRDRLAANRRAQITFDKWGDKTETETSSIKTTP